MIITSAPGKIILFGEHAVVYDKLGIACSIDKRCNVEVLPNNKDEIVIESENLNLSGFLKEGELTRLFEEIDALRQKGEFDKIKEIAKGDELAPVFFVVANVFKKYGFSGLKLKIKSDVPKSLGSSSAVFSAAALGILNFLGHEPQREEISNFAFQGDLMAHGGTPSGIDNNVVTFGGYLKYKKSEGVLPLKVDFEIPLLIVDSGEEAKTGEMVSYVRKMRQENCELVDLVLNSLDDISKEALTALHSADFEALGQLMNSYYLELKKLNVSSPNLDKIVNIALDKGALGVKPTGGWGGGCCLVLARNHEKISELEDAFKENHFKYFRCKTGTEGVKLIWNFV